MILVDSYEAVFLENYISVGKVVGETNYIERFNDTIKQRLARYKRKTRFFNV